jgi:uncharacterized OsmC-like protein
MFGTLKGALDVRQVKVDGDALRAEVEGMHELRDGLPVLTRVNVRYRMRIPRGTRESVDKALARHAARCPTANSLKGAVEVSWEAEIEEV